MRRLLKCLMVAALAFALSPMSEAQTGWFPLVKAGAGSSYTGPGDVLATGWIFWWGLRAFSSTTAGTKSANICNSGDANCADVNTLANGNFDVATATGAPLNCGGAGGTCTIKVLYDKSGNTNCTTACDFTQTTIANRPTLVFNCINTTLPCVRYAGGTGKGIFTAALTSTFLQPFTVSLVMKNTGGSFGDYLTASGHASFLVEHAANTPSLSAGAIADFTASDSVFHAIQATFNGTTPTNSVSVDGTLSSPNPGGNGIGSGDAFNFGDNGFGSGAPTADTGEMGWNSASLVGTNATNLCSNQRTYWGISGSC